MVRLEGDLGRHQERAPGRPTVEDRVRGGIQVLVTLSREGAGGQEEEDVEMLG